MTPNPHPTHHGPYTELTAEAARDLRRPISPDEVRFKVQAVRWTKRDGQDKVATAAQVVAYIDARTVVARLNLLFPGHWQAPTDALPLEMRLTRRNADGTLTPIRLTDQGEVKADHTLYYRCRLSDRRRGVRGRRRRRRPEGRLLRRDQARRRARRHRRVPVRHGLAVAARRRRRQPAARQPRRQAVPRRAHHPLAATACTRRG